MKSVCGVLLFLRLIQNIRAIIVEPAPVVNVSYGKPMYFNCTCSNNWKVVVLQVPGEIGFKFAIFNGGSCQVPVEKRSDFSVSCYGDTMKYGILQPADNTTWQCLCHDSNGAEETSNTRVNMLPELPNVTPQKQTYVVREGADASIACNFTGAPIANVTWNHKNEVLTWSNINQPLFLSFHNVSRALAGNYTCEVTVKFKGTYASSEIFNVVVVYPPTLKSGNDTTVAEGTEVNIACEIAVHGNPANYSLLRWQHWIGNTLIRNLTLNSLINNKLSTSLPSVTMFDSGRYVCLVSNGLPDYGGNREQSADIELVVQGIPRILPTKYVYVAQVGKSYRVIHECVGIPETSTFSMKSNKSVSGQPLFNTTEAIKFVKVDVYGTTVEMNGRSIEMNFGVIKGRFNLSFEITAENSIGIAKQTFLVEAHDFPSEPFNIYVKEYNTHILLEWEADTPDLDMVYEILIKNNSGNDKVIRYRGSNSKVYATNLTTYTEITIQICTTNVLGKNCSSKFKGKREKQVVNSDVLKKTPETTWIALVVIGAIGFLNILACVVFLTNRKRKDKRKGSKLLSLERHNYSFERNNYSSHRADNESTDQSKDYGGNLNKSLETYLTPEAMTSQKSDLSLQQSGLDGNEYASVDDPAILKMNPKRGYYNGLYQATRNSREKEAVPKLPSRPNPEENAYLTTESPTEAEECENDAYLNSNDSPSLLLEMAQQSGDGNHETTQYLTCTAENEKGTLKITKWEH